MPFIWVILGKIYILKVNATPPNVLRHKSARAISKWTATKINKLADRKTEGVCSKIMSTNSLSSLESKKSPNASGNFVCKFCRARVFLYLTCCAWYRVSLVPFLLQQKPSLEGNYRSRPFQLYTIQTIDNIERNYNHR